MGIRLLITVFFFCYFQELLAQAWTLRHDYPLELPGKVRYAQFPDSLLSFLKTNADESLDQIRNRAASFKSIPESIQLEVGDVHWLKGSFINSDITDIPFLVEVDGFREMKHIDEVMEKLWSEVDVFLFAKDSLVRKISIGDNVPPANRQIRDARNLFWITADYPKHITFFIRLESKVKLRRPGFGMRLYDQTSLYDFTGFTFRGFDEKPDTYRSLWPLKKVLSVWNSLEYVIDTQQIHTFANLRESWDQNALYFQSKYADLSAQHILWCRLKVVNESDSTKLYWFDAASNAPIIEAYIPDRNGDYQKVISGNNIPMEEKQIPHTLNLISFELAALDSGYIYLRYHNSSKINNTYLIPLFFLDRNEVLTKSRTLGLWKAFVLGVLIFQIVYFALRAGLEHDRLGAYYLLVILGFLLFFIANENRVNTFMAWQIWFEFNDFLYTAGYAFIAIGMFLFANQYLQLKEYFQGVLKVQKINLILIICILIPHTIQQGTSYVYSSLFYQLPFTALLLFFLGVLLLIYLSTAIVGITKGFAHASSYLLAFLPFSFVGLLNSFQYTLQNELPLWRIDLLYISFIATTVLFAIVVAKRNNATKEREIQATNLIELNQAKSKFYDNITHEFRTPLTVIRGLANMIRGHEEEKALIQKNSQEVLSLVDRLIGFSKAQSILKPLKFVEDNIIMYLEYLQEVLQPLAREKRIDIRFHHETEEIILSFDREKFRLIFNNLLSNAIKYTSEGGVIQVTAGTENDQFVVTVEDNGVGMAPEELANIFDRYYQVKNPLTTREQIGGIGLALIKEEVERLEGSIRVESKKGEGTTFMVTLPLYPAEDAHEKPAREVAKSLHLYPVGDKHIVLLVEDSPDVRFYLNRLLSTRYKIVTASDGEEGFKKATTLIPDIIISDVIMPKTDGYRLTAKLKEDLRTSHIPIILLTAKGKHQDKMEGLSEGADAYLIKPFEEDELELRIRKLIENREHLKMAYTREGIPDNKGQVVDPFLKKAIGVLEQHFREEAFGAKELAHNLHLSRMQVHRKLKAVTNFSACQFINHFRLEKGKVLLLKNEQNISEVAYSCGFSDPGYFSKLFTKAYGVSPLQFKNNDLSSKNPAC